MRPTLFLLVLPFSHAFKFRWLQENKGGSAGCYSITWRQKVKVMPASQEAKISRSMTPEERMAYMATYGFPDEDGDGVAEPFNLGLFCHCQEEPEKFILGNSPRGRSVETDCAPFKAPSFGIGFNLTNLVGHCVALSYQQIATPTAFFIQTFDGSVLPKDRPPSVEEVTFKAGTFTLGGLGFYDVCTKDPQPPWEKHPYTKAPLKAPDFDSESSTMAPLPTAAEIVYNAGKEAQEVPLA